MTELDIQHFDQFFRELHGPCKRCERQGVAAHACQHIEPFQWQRDLVKRVRAEGWPSCIALPTASGKTAVIDIAIFVLALDDSENRSAPLRIFFVVDRRIVVDEAYRRASRIAARLAAAKSGVLYSVAQRLRRLTGEREDVAPLVTAALRGGMYREDGWARSPVQPLVAVSTVDQVGSRLLGRGYGVGDGMKPVHQGLIAHESLIILDEAHLSEPFQETLQALHDYAQLAAVRLPRLYQVVVMSATPRSTESQAFRLEPNHGDLTDRGPGRLAQRIETHKRAELRLADLGKPPSKSAPKQEYRKWSAGAAERNIKFSEEIVAAARAMATRVQCVGVVVNRVQTARIVFEKFHGDASFDAVLLTGRSRPLDRQAVIESIWPRAQAGRERQQGDKPLIIVATQCIEAGADLDFDSLVTECASFDALKQRFGRLDRLGELGESRAIVIARSDTLDSDPVYGEAIGKTWKWLQRKEKKPKPRTHSGTLPEIDFGHAHIPVPSQSELEDMLAPRREAPILLPAHLDAWAMTSPRPAADPDIGMWLHGITEEAADVQIVWRSDLPANAADRWAEIVALCPPGSTEAMPLPVYLARAWLGRRTDLPEIADTIVDVADSNGTGAETLSTDSRRALRWCGEDDPRTAIVRAFEIRPGDTLVVPSVWGGADEYGWKPYSSEDTQRPVVDLGDRVQIEQRGRAILRVCPALSSRWVPATSGIQSVLHRLVQDAVANIEEGGDLPDVDHLLARLTETDEAAPWLRETARRLRIDARKRIDVHPSGGIVLRASRRLPYHSSTATGHADEAGTDPDFTTQDDVSSFVCRPVSLRNHSLGVENLAKKFAAGCGLDPDLISDLALSGRLHDVGKADPRFQRWLHGGDEVAAAALSEPRAKSGMQSRRLRERARLISRYPKDARHELLSLAMVESEIQALGAHDTDLVLHLVASHHGFCRPFAAAFDDPDTLVVELTSDIVGHALSVSTDRASRMTLLDSGVSERYWSLLQKFGWLGLPYLETILRLADHRQSEIEEKEGDTL